MKFNSLQVNKIISNLSLDKLHLNSLETNENLSKIENKYIKKFGLKKQKTFSFTKDGFFALIMSLDGKIAISSGESEPIIKGATLAKNYGKDIEFLKINKNGEIDLSLLNHTISYIFISTYIVDTFVKIDLQKVKRLSNAKIISNITSDLNFYQSDILCLDCYKLTGHGQYGVILYNDEIEDSYISEISLLSLELCMEAIENRVVNYTMKKLFLKSFKDLFKDDLFLFVNPDLTLENTLHIGLKDIKARELIRTLVMDNIFISNGEGCSLGLMKPSQTIQNMSYSENESRWCITMDFTKEYSISEIENIVTLINKRYRQIKALQ